MKKFFKKIFEAIIFALGFDGEIRKQMVDADLLNFEGQGKNEYGK